METQRGANSQSRPSAGFSLFVGAFVVLVSRVALGYLGMPAPWVWSFLPSGCPPDMNQVVKLCVVVITWATLVTLVVLVSQLFRSLFGGGPSKPFDLGKGD